MKAKCAHCGKPVKLKPTQKAQVKRGHKIYCNDNDKECYDASMRIIQKKHRDKKRKKLEPIECGYRYCDNVFMPDTDRRAYCPGTNHAYLEILARQKGGYKPKPKKLRYDGKPKRKCRICGEDPAPNYYFCRSCHRRVSAIAENDVWDENPIVVWG